MEKLKDKIEKYINKTGVIRTPAYFIKDLFNDIIVWCERKINSFFSYITNIHDYLNKGFTVIYDNENPNTYMSIINSDYENKAFILENNKIVSGYKRFPKGYKEYHFITECYDDLFYVPSYQPERSLISQIKLSNTIEYIGKNFFAGQTKITEVIIPDSVKEIRDGAFRGCTGLTSIIIPNSVTTIGNEAFAHCTNLTSIQIGNSVTTIGDYCFQDCTSLTTINLNNVMNIGYCVFDRCSNLNKILTKASNIPLLTKYDSNYNIYNLILEFNSNGNINILHLGYYYNLTLTTTSDGLIKGLNEIYLDDNIVGKLTINIPAFDVITNTKVIPDIYQTLNLNILINGKETTEYFLITDNNLNDLGIFGNAFTFKPNTISNILLSKLDYYAYSGGYMNEWDPKGLYLANGCDINIPNANLVFNVNNKFCKNNVKVSRLAIRSFENWIQSDIDYTIFDENSVLEFGFNTPASSRQNLSHIVIKDDVEYIGVNTISGLSSVESITISKSVKKIREHFNCPNLTEIYYKGTIDDWCKIDCSETILNNKKLYVLDETTNNYILVENVIIKDVVNENEIKQLCYYDYIKTCIIENSNVKGMLNSCNNLENITIKTSNLSNCCNECNNILETNIDEYSIISSSFNYYLSNLASIENPFRIIGSNLIGINADYIDKTSSYTLENIKYVNSCVATINELILPNVIKINKRAFYNASITSLKLGNKLFEIDELAFLYSNITDLTIETEYNNIIIHPNAFTGGPFYHDEAASIRNLHVKSNAIWYRYLRIAFNKIIIE